jgi:hypothetical protein
VRKLHLPVHIAFVAAIALSAAVFALATSAQPVMASGAADAQASDLYRLINGERAYLGKSAMRVDTYLAGKARDGAIACPNNASRVMYGRAKDFAVYGYPSNSHLLRLCTQYTALDAMAKWGYNTYRGEVTAVNGGYGTVDHSYTFGCSPTVRTCKGSTTTASYTAGITMRDWMGSSTHYAVLMGNYDRMGCGVWVGSNGAFFYDCLVSKGGRTGSSSSRATTRPATPVLTPPPSAVPSSTGALPSSTPYKGLVPQAVEPAVTPTPSPTPNPTVAQVQVAAAVVDQNPAPTGSSGSGNVSAAAAAASALISLGSGLFLSIRRRRARKTAAD